MSTSDPDSIPDTPCTADSSTITSGDDKVPPDAPLSKIRAVALVSTVTGAAFLNVSILLPTSTQL
jgi:hypothetical protein